MTGDVRDVTEELTGSIPARLWRVTERVASDVYFLANRSESDWIINDRRWCSNLTPNENGARSVEPGGTPRSRMTPVPLLKTHVPPQYAW